MEGKKKATSVRMVTVMHEKRNRRKVCMLFVVHISSDKGKDVEDAEVMKTYSILQQFQNVFLVDSEYLPHREVDLYIELVLRETSTSKVMVRDSCIVRYVARSISRGIFRTIRVVGLRFTVHKMRT